ncbi:MAG: CDP-alcohol phosphatidyltransferase family protein, partial [Acetobacteraceae bacterium]
AEGTAQAALLEGTANLFGLPGAPERIEVYDNSHIQGANAYGVMVVAGPSGFIKQGYRKFTIKTAATNDDFAMMREVFERRFGRALREDPARAGDGWPDLVLIDGGAGQLSAAREIMAGLGLDDLPLVAVAKGPDRDAGLFPAIVIMLREILVSGLREFLAELRVGLPVTPLAKWKTGFQMGALGTLLAGDSGAPVIGLGFLPVSLIGEGMLWAAAVLTLITGWDYLRAGLSLAQAETPASRDVEAKPPGQS